MNTKKTLVYDFPMRLFHWSFSILFLASYGIADLVDEQSATFSYHMIIGFVLSFILILRIIWLFIGSRWARLSSFELRPRLLLNYLKSAFYSKTNRYPGHNPATSWLAIIMFGIVFLLAITGYLMVSTNLGGLLEDFHEVLSTAFIWLIVFHILGILFHTYQHKTNIAMSMIKGKKYGVKTIDEISSAHYVAGIIYIILVALFVGYLLFNYDSDTQVLKILNSHLYLSN